MPFLLLFLLLLIPCPVRADDPPPPRTIIVLAPAGLCYDDLRPDGGGRLPDVAALANAGSVALLNTAVSGEATEAAAFLSIGAGERMAAPEHRGTRYHEEGTERSAAQMATEFYTWSGGPEGKRLSLRYYQRFGIAPPANALHLGLPALAYAQPSASRADQIGALGAALAQSEKRVVVPPGDWRAALIGMDTKGSVSVGDTATDRAAWFFEGKLPEADVVIVAAPDVTRLNALARRLLPLSVSRAANVLLVAAAPPEADGKWNRLGFLAAAGPTFPPHTLLASSTTRTPGLVANVDIAPTVLALEHAGLLPGGAGRALHPVAHPAVWNALAALDRQTTGTARATVPVSLGYGVFAIGAALLAAGALWRKNARLARSAHFALLTAAAALLALLPVGVVAPLAPWQYGAAVFLLSVALAALAHHTGARTRTNPFALLFCTTAAAVVADAFFGSPLVARALLSGYYLPGIRFYGIGNEYMGLLVGCALTGPALFDTSSSARTSRFLAFALAVGALLALGLPQFGADAGGLLGASVAFVVAFFARRHARLQPRHIALAFAAAFLLVATMAVIDRTRPADARTHVGAAIAAGQQHGAGALVEIAVRKVAMNIALTLNPYTIIAVGALMPVWILLARGKTGEQARNALSTRPALARLLPAAGWGALTAFIFNDSGIVAALLLLAPPTVAVLQAMLHDLTVSG